MPNRVWKSSSFSEPSTSQKQKQQPERQPRQVFSFQQPQPRLVRASTLNLPTPQLLLNVPVTIDFIGDVQSMTMNWNSSEQRNSRRLVSIQSHQNYSHLGLEFHPVAVEDYVPGSPVLSCIYWKRTGRFYLTSVELITLLEHIVNCKFPVEEKNRIRRNLQSIKPLTISKSSEKYHELFDLIMNFSNPKPRRIEKDVKVIYWDHLKEAIAKVMSKYIVDPSSAPPQGNSQLPGQTSGAPHYFTQALVPPSFSPMPPQMYYQQSPEQQQQHTMNYPGVSSSTSTSTSTSSFMDLPSHHHHHYQQQQQQQQQQHYPHHHQHHQHHHPHPHSHTGIYTDLKNTTSSDSLAPQHLPQTMMHPIQYQIAYQSSPSITPPPSSTSGSVSVPHIKREPSPFYHHTTTGPTASPFELSSGGYTFEGASAASSGTATVTSTGAAAAGNATTTGISNGTEEEQQQSQSAVNGNGSAAWGMVMQYDQYGNPVFREYE